jgi:hypothetical protein
MQGNKANVGMCKQGRIMVHDTAAYTHQVRHSPASRTAHAHSAHSVSTTKQDVASPPAQGGTY